MRFFRQIDNVAAALQRCWQYFERAVELPRGPRSGRFLLLESLEPRLALAAVGLVDVGAQPQGALTGKIVYTHAGHGYYANNLGNGSWSTQRGETFEIVEDFGNQDQMNFFADYLFRAGATVVPLRPIGHQVNEVILDNDDTGVTFSGPWSNSTANVYFGSAGDVPYRFASTSPVETAYARYQPNITVDGFYPVYAWTRAGTDRASDQLYRVSHSGGITEVTVNHRRVGNGLVYLGTYYFEAGTAGYVDVSNRSNDAGKVVIADMIRFGNGMGDISRGGGVSGQTREDEAGLYWVMWHVDRSQGIPASEYRSSSDDRTAAVSFSPRYSEYMNQGTGADGLLRDRVFVSFHSNAAGGRGVLGLYNGNNTPSSATPNQFNLAQKLGQEVNDDLVAQNGQFEYSWFNAGTNVTLDRSDIEFGEINNSVIGNEFDATIVEVAFHDNLFDAALMRDPKVRDAVGRATYQGLVRYFNSVDGGATPIIMLPGRVPQARAESAGPGSVTVTWTAPAANAYNGDAPAGYRIYGSTNGYGFDGGTFVAGGGTLSYTFTGLDANEGTYYFKVAAVNTGGEGAASEVVAVVPGDNSAARVLIVNGFDRLDRSLNPVQAYGAGTVERVRPRNSNSFDYAIQAAAAIEANSPGVVVNTTANEFIVSGDVNLGDYDAVIWMLGEESTANDTFDATEQAKVAAYLAGGGKLFVSGSEIGFDLDGQNNGRAFYNNQLRADYAADDANSYAASGPAGSIFAGLSLAIDNGSHFYNVDFPDVIVPLGGATAALIYGSGGTAAVQFTDAGTGAQVVNMAFPLESVVGAAQRATLMGQVLQYFGFSIHPGNIDQVLDNDDGPAVYAETGSWSTSSSTGYNGTTYRFAPTEAAATARWQFTAPVAGQSEVFVQYRAGTNRASNAVYRIDTGAGVETRAIDQKLNDLVWVSLGVFDFLPGLRTITLDAAASTAGSVVIADAVRVTLSTAPPPATGDFNGDGEVDGADLLLWQQGLGVTSGATRDQGDADGDGIVDGADLEVWLTEFGGPMNLAAASHGSEAAVTIGPIGVAEASPTIAYGPLPFTGPPALSHGLSGDRGRHVARIESAIMPAARQQPPRPLDSYGAVPRATDAAFAQWQSRWRAGFTDETASPEGQLQPQSSDSVSSRSVRADL